MVTTQDFINQLQQAGFYPNIPTEAAARKRVLDYMEKTGGLCNNYIRQVDGFVAVRIEFNINYTKKHSGQILPSSAWVRGQSPHLKQRTVRHLNGTYKVVKWVIPIASAVATLTSYAIDKEENAKQDFNLAGHPPENPVGRQDN